MPINGNELRLGKSPSARYHRPAVRPPVPSESATTEPAARASPATPNTSSSTLNGATKLMCSCVHTIVAPSATLVRCTNLYEPAERKTAARPPASSTTGLLLGVVSPTSLYVCAGVEVPARNTSSKPPDNGLPLLSKAEYFGAGITVPTLAKAIPPAGRVGRLDYQPWRCIGETTARADACRA